MIAEEHVKASKPEPPVQARAIDAKARAPSERIFSKAEKIRYYREWIRDELYDSRFLAKLEELSKN